MAQEFWTFIARRLRQGESVFAAHVAHNTRHSPGTTGAQLAVAKTGATCGTIGGGIMEADVLSLAQKALVSAEFSPQYKRLYHRRNAPSNHSGTTSGLGCAGNQTNIYHVLTPEDDLSTVEDIIARIAQDRSGLVQLSQDGLKLVDHRPEQIEAPFRFVADEPWSFSRQLLNWKRIAIIGGGHCGLALSRVMNQLGYTVTVFDTRPEIFTFVDNKYARHRIVVDDYAEAGKAITHTAWTHVVVMSANVDDDIRGLYGVADRPFPYIGIMGAPAKLARIRRELIELEVEAESIDSLYAPIGIEMTSNTPDEIAISVAAEILREREELFPFCRFTDI